MRLRLRGAGMNLSMVAVIVLLYIPWQKVVGYLESWIAGQLIVAELRGGSVFESEKFSI